MGIVIVMEFDDENKSVVDDIINLLKKDFRVLSTDEQKVFMEYALSGSPYYKMYVVAVGTGMRSGELRALEWDDVDFKNKLVHVTGTLKFRKGDGYFKDTPKSASSDREIPMLDEVYKILKEQRKEQLENRTLLGEAWQPQEGLENLVFTSPYHRKGYGLPVGEAVLNVDMKKIVKRINAAGIEFEEITPHTLRHTFATRGLENGIPPKVMQELLGHTSITMTLDIYSHVLPDTKASEIQKIANMF
ncbi:MAG: site-specific integrase [Lachnospiraceae bacterium]|nr:site-specific integrase [Lachnospiraceae bacterium]